MANSTRRRPPPTRASRARTRPIGSLLQLEVGGSEGAEVLDRLPLLSQVAHARMHSLIEQDTPCIVIGNTVSFLSANLPADQAGGGIERGA